MNLHSAFSRLFRFETKVKGYELDHRRRDAKFTKKKAFAVFPNDLLIEVRHKTGGSGG